jgi:transcriptional adapter 2-alpha
MFGMGNWEQISEHIGTKTRVEVADHYESVYVNSDSWPLPVGHSLAFSQL